MKKNMLNDVFAITYDEFIKLNKKQQIAVSEKAAEINQDFVKNFFLTHREEISWIAIAKKKGNVIAIGWLNQPDQDHFTKKAKELNRVIFTYSRCSIVEKNQKKKKRQTMTKKEMHE